MLILVWVERSLHPAQVSGQSCPLPLKLRMSQAVEGMWNLQGQLWVIRGKWVKTGPKQTTGPASNADLFPQNFSSWTESILF